jgi:hypothetical protein
MFRVVFYGWGATSVVVVDPVFGAALVLHFSVAVLNNRTTFDKASVSTEFVVEDAHPSTLLT